MGLARIRRKVGRAHNPAQKHGGFGAVCRDGAGTEVVDRLDVAGEMFDM
jgi:hypothetical protein